MPMHCDPQGMAVAVEQVVRAIGGQGTQLSKMFHGLWDTTEVGRILETLLEHGQRHRKVNTVVRKISNALDLTRLKLAQCHATYP